MRSLLDALQEGRLVELPEVSKEKALEYLALLIEAIPDIGSGTDLVKAVMDREATFNTGIGKGVAVPHCRTNADGELLCAVGWSPKGIDYGAIDAKPVHLLVMYYVPDAQRNLYLKEISGLAKVLSGSDVLENFQQLESLTDLREHLLDWVSQAIGEAVPDAKARMIKLEAKQASIETAAVRAVTAGDLQVDRFIPFDCVCYGDHVLVLCQDSDLIETLEHADGFHDNVKNQSNFEAAGYRIVRLAEVEYAHGRRTISAVAFKNA
ncbi:MAG: PTS sugar transporter subunit IIA [Spirochaetales bacterium]|nr:PTS sugar transporter subunit IIA [Spirochaetales bacterium]